MPKCVLDSLLMLNLQECKNEFWNVEGFALMGLKLNDWTTGWQNNF
jgi:hypothetical protein